MNKYTSLYYLFLILALSSVQPLRAQQANRPSTVLSPNALRMRAYLRANKEKAEFLPLGGFLINDRGVDYYRQQLKTAPQSKVLNIRANIAEQMLKSGKTEDAIHEIEQIISESRYRPDLPNQPESYSNLKQSLGLCYYRLGEQQNCILDHNAESCIFPISSKAFYKIKDPTRKAISIFKEILEDNPKNMQAQWLMNLAYMNLGNYPDSVPKNYLIPNKTLDSDYKIGRFTDVTSSLGFETKNLSGSAIMDDFDNDNDLDLFIGTEGYDSQCAYMMQNADGTFSDRTKEAGLIGELGGRISIQADYNNDGFLDIFVTRGGWQNQENNFPPNSLLKNNGDGTFTNVTIESGLLAFYPTSTACWGDYDNDGWVDLFVANETQDLAFPHPCQLYHNNGDGTFTDVAKECGLDLKGFIKGAVWGDYDNDGYQDIFISDIRGPHFLFKNNGKKNGKITFTDVSAKANIQNTPAGISVFFFDYNNDGWLDIFAPAFPLVVKQDFITSLVGEYLGKSGDDELYPALFENNKSGGFKNVNTEVGLNRGVFTMGCNFGDIDNDGYKDIYAGTGNLEFATLFPNLMFRNDAGKKFQDVTTATGTGNLQKGHGVSFGDIDNDGDQDIYEVLGGGYSGDIYQNALFINPGNENHWMKIKLEGNKSNRSAIGAKIKVTVEEDNSTRDIYTTITSGGSFGASTLIAEIGLGKAKKIRDVEVYWPASNTKQNFHNLTSDAFYKIKENQNEPELVHVSPVTLKRNNAAMNHH